MMTPILQEFSSITEAQASGEACVVVWEPTAAPRVEERKGRKRVRPWPNEETPVTAEGEIFWRCVPTPRHEQNPELYSIGPALFAKGTARVAATHPNLETIPTFNPDGTIVVRAKHRDEVPDILAARLAEREFLARAGVDPTEDYPGERAL